MQWISQTFLQLTLLSIIMVGQQVLGAASDKRAINTYADAEAILKEAQQIQAHLLAQDAALEVLADKLGVELRALKAAAGESLATAHLQGSGDGATTPDSGRGGPAAAS